MQLTKEQTDALEQAVTDVDHEATLEFDYSGRGMYGKRCIGIITENPIYMVLQLMMYLDDEIRQFLADNDVRTDSMGLQEIIYWPDISTEYEEDDD